MLLKWLKNRSLQLVISPHIMQALNIAQSALNLDLLAMSVTPPNLFQFASDNSNEEFANPSDLAVLLNAIGSAGKFISSEINRAALRDFFGSAGAAKRYRRRTAEARRHRRQRRRRSVALDWLGLCDEFRRERWHDRLRQRSDHRRIRRRFRSRRRLQQHRRCCTNRNHLRHLPPPQRRKSQPGIADILRPGNEMLAAGYVLYGSSTIFCYTSGDGVHFFTLDPSLGDYLLTNEYVRSHGSSHVYSANEGNSGKWNAPDLNWVEHVKSEGYSGRYIGALVADFHRNLMKGGIYAYPGDTG